jgi:hypothetical protein
VNVRMISYKLKKQGLVCDSFERSWISQTDVMQFKAITALGLCSR